MTGKRTPIFVAILLIIAILVSACGGNSQLDNNVATLNAIATQGAGGSTEGGSTEGGSADTPTEEPIVEATAIQNLHDITNDQAALLVTEWGQTNGLPSGSEFTLIATQRQVGKLIIDTLQLQWKDEVSGGTAAIGSGQIRLDLALVDSNGEFGTGSVSFQPTLDENGNLKLNALGGDFGSLKIPAALLGAFGDATYSALTGAPNDNLSAVNVQFISLENGIMEIRGVRR